jgi:hypothetical protein
VSAPTPDPLAGLAGQMSGLAADLRGVVGGSAGLADLADKADEAVVLAARLQIRLSEGDRPGAISAAEVLRETIDCIRAELERRS